MKPSISDGEFKVILKRNWDVPALQQNSFSKCQGKPFKCLLVGSGEFRPLMSLGISLATTSNFHLIASRAGSGKIKLGRPSLGFRWFNRNGLTVYWIELCMYIHWHASHMYAAGCTQSMLCRGSCPQRKFWKISLMKLNLIQLEVISNK